MKTCAEGQSFCDTLNHPRIGITLDTFHANIEERNIAESIPLLGRHLRHIHLSENDRGMLGTGHIDFPRIINELKRLFFQGTLVIEGFGTSAPVNAMDPLWRNPAVRSDDLAQESAQFIETLLRPHVARQRLC
jgi:D-psicose/D-tagatose/L-ribulose 3-epimerase